DPVLNLQTGDLAKVFQVTRNQRGTVGQGDGSDQHISSANFFQLLILSQAVELGSNIGVNGKNLGNSCHGSFSLVESLLTALQLGFVGSLEQGRETSLKDFDPTHDRDGNVVGGLAHPLKDAGMITQKERVSVSRTIMIHPRSWVGPVGG